MLQISVCRKTKALLAKADDYKMFSLSKNNNEKKSVIIALINWLNGRPVDCEIQ